MEEPLVVDASALKFIIRLQGIVRARIAAKTMKGKVHMHLFRTKVTLELLASDKSYIKDLIVAIDEFYMPVSTVLPQEQLDILFANIKEIIAVHVKFCAVLESKLKGWGYTACIADAILPLLDNFSCYEKYINNFSQAMDFLTTHINEQTNIAKLFESKTQNCKACRGLGLSAFLIMPIQRLPRIILLIKELIKYTPAQHPDLKNTQEALSRITKLTETLNHSRRKAENKDKIRTIAKSISGLNLDEVSTRHFLREGALEELTPNRASFRSLLTSSSSSVIMDRIEYYVFMFEDALLCAKRLSAPARVVKNLGKKQPTYQFSTPSLVTLPLPPSCVAKPDNTVDYAFKVDYIDNDSENTNKQFRLFAAPTAKERDDWIKKINNR